MPWNEIGSRQPTGVLRVEDGTAHLIAETALPSHLAGEPVVGRTGLATQQATQAGAARSNLILIDLDMQGVCEVVVFTLINRGAYVPTAVLLTLSNEMFRHACARMAGGDRPLKAQERRQRSR